MKTIQVSEESTEKKDFCRYQVAVFAAQRARQIMEGDKPTCEPGPIKPTTMAIAEIHTGALSFFYGQEAIRYQEDADKSRRVLKSQLLFKEREEELRREMTKL